jgi:hypothetical protein
MNSESVGLQGRYSVVGAQPAMEIVAKACNVTVMDHEMRSKKEHHASDPMTVARDIMEQWNPQITDGLPDAFCGKSFLALCNSRLTMLSSVNVFMAFL